MSLLNAVSPSSNLTAFSWSLAIPDPHHLTQNTQLPIFHNFETTEEKISHFIKNIQLVDREIDLTSLKTILEKHRVFSSSNTPNQVVQHALVKPKNYLSRLFSDETWEEWTEHRTTLGRVVALWNAYLESPSVDLKQLKKCTLLQANKESKVLLEKLLSIKDSLELKPSDGFKTNFLYDSSCISSLITSAIGSVATQHPIPGILGLTGCVPVGNGEHFEISPNGEFQIEQNSAVLSDGNFVMVWTKAIEDGERDGVFAQLFSSNGKKMGDEFLVKISVPGVLSSPSVKALNDGKFLVTWASTQSNGSNKVVSGQVFSSYSSDFMSFGFSHDFKLYQRAINSDPQDTWAYFKLLDRCFSCGHQMEDGTHMSAQDLLRRVISVDPTCAEGYVRLAHTLYMDQSITLENGSEMSHKELYKRAIALDPTFFEAYHFLGLHLHVDESIVLEDGTTISQQELYKRTITLNPDFWGAYFNLGRSMILNPELRWGDLAYKPELRWDNLVYNDSIFPKGVTTTLEDGTVMTPQKLFIKAIGLNPGFILSYQYLALTLNSHETIAMNDDTSMSKEDLLNRAISLSKSAESYYLLGIFMTENSITLENGTIMTKQELFDKALPFAPAYAALGNLLGSKDSITLSDGSTFSCIELYIKAISLNPNSYHTYIDLANRLPHEGSVTLENGVTMTKKELYAKAIVLNSKHPRAYRALFNYFNHTFLPDTTFARVTLEDGREISFIELWMLTIDLEQEPFKKIIAEDPQNAWAYLKLADIDSTTVILKDGTTFSKRKLLLKAITLNPQYAKAYFKLALSLGFKESIILENQACFFSKMFGETMNKQSLLKRVIALDPSFPNAYYQLALTLKAGETTTLESGVEMSLEELFIREIISQPSHYEAYFKLGEAFMDPFPHSWYYPKTIFPKKASMVLEDGTKITPKQCFKRVIALKSDYANAYLYLALTLNDTGITTLEDGTQMSKQQLLKRAIALSHPDENILAYHYLALTMDLNETTTLEDGSSMTKLELLERACSLWFPEYHEFGPTYFELGNLLDITGEVAILKDGTVMTPKELYELTIAFDPTFGPAYEKLANCLEDGESFEFEDGLILTKQELYVKAQECNPAHYATKVEE